MIFLLTNIFLFFLSRCRVQDCGEEHSVETRSDKQDDTQVGKKNGTNQQLWYDTAHTFNFMQNYLHHHAHLQRCHH